MYMHHFHGLKTGLDLSDKTQDCCRVDIPSPGEHAGSRFQVCPDAGGPGFCPVCCTVFL